MNKFEQLIEFVINDEEDKARELFHEIVVEKSRDIYENIMAEEETVEEDAEVVEEDETVEEAVEEDAEAVEEGIEEIEDLGGSQTEGLIDEIEAEEEGISMEAEGDEEEDADMEDLEDRVVSVEDKLDELMAEFNELMGADAEGEEDMEDMGDEEEVDMDMDMDMETESLEEGADLTAAPKPVTSEEGSVNTKSTYADNSGAKGAEAKPVSETGGEEKGRTAPKAQDQGGTTQPNEAAAPKAETSEPAGINDKSPIGS
jgi:hypothetical protein